MKKITFSFLVFTFIQSILVAQHLNVNSSQRFVKHFELNQSINSGDFTIGFSGGAPAGITWSFCVGNPCPSGPMTVMTNSIQTIGGNIQATFMPNQIQITTPTSSTATGNEHFVTFQAEDDNGIITSRSYHFIVRRPLQIAYVLDASGSMECGAGVTNWPSCTTSVDKRWDILGTALNGFMNKLAEDATNQARILETDSFSLVYFAGDTINDPIGLNRWRDYAFFTNNLDMSMNQVSTPELGRDGTSVGAGLLRAFNDRFDKTDNHDLRQVLILFTDGEPNRPPDLVAPDPDNASIGSKNIKSDAMKDPSLDNIEIFSIGIGVGPSFKMMIQHLATEPDNYFNTTTGMEADFLGEMATNVFHQVFNTHTPKMIRFENQTAQNSNKITVTSNQQVNQLFFDAYFEQPIANRYRYALQKDGVSIDLDADFIRKNKGDYAASYVLDLQYAKDLTSEGEWIFTCEGDVDKPSRLRLVATADDHNIDMKTKVLNQPLRVGNKMNLKLDFKHLNQPITNAKVSALILKPGDDLGDILARTETPPFSSTNHELSCTEQKYAYLLANQPELFEALKTPIRTTVELKHTGNGIYEGIYDDLDVTGTYKVIFSAFAEVAGTGIVERMKEQTVNVRYSTNGLNTLDQRAIVLKKTTGTVRTQNWLRSTDLTAVNTNQEVTLYARPTYNVGSIKRLIGTGLSLGFDVKGKGVEKVEVVENCNGAYDLNLGLSEKNPDIEVSLFGDKLYEGKVKYYNTPYLNYKWGLSLHGGGTQPLGILDSSYQSGFYGEIDLSYQFSPTFTLEAIGGYYQFNANGGENIDDYNILGGILYGKVHLLSRSTGRFSTDVSIGIGYFQPKDLEYSIGYSGRINGNYRLNNHWYLFGEASLFTLPDPDYSFITYGGGIKVQF